VIDNLQEEDYNFGFWDFRPLPQRFGGRVFAFISIPGGTYKTYSMYSVIQEFSMQTSGEKILAIDATFSGSLGFAFGVPKSKRGQLNKLLSRANNAQLSGGTLSSKEYSDCIMHLNDNVDLILSCKFDDDYYPWDGNPLFGIMPLIMSNLRSQYKCILLDMPSGVTLSYLPLISTVNYVLVPFPIFDGRDLFQSFRQIDRIVSSLILKNYPIDCCKIIPVYNRRVPRISKMVLAELKKIFGKFMWPVVPGDDIRFKTVAHDASDICDVGFSKVREKIIGAMHRRFPYRHKSTITGGRKIIDFIWNNPYHSYCGAANFIPTFPENRGLKLTGGTVRMWSNALSSLGTKTPELCKQKIFDIKYGAGKK